MSWRKIRLIILAVIAAFLVICVSGIAIANSKNEIQIFKMGTDVIVPEQKVMTDAVAIGGDVTILNHTKSASQNPFFFVPDKILLSSVLSNF